MSVTRELAEFATQTRAEALPPEIVHLAKRNVINIMGVALYSAVDPSLDYILNVFKAEGGNARAGVWGTSFKTTLQNAAMANGYLAHLEDYDDTHFPTVLHPSAPTIPAAWAFAENAGASGRDLVAAVALGIEVACRFAIAVHPWHYDAGWHITGTAGVFGSVAASSRMLGLDVDQTTAAFGIAGTQAAGVREVFGTMTKPFHAGRAAQAGVTAALLAQQGFTSAMNIIEGRRGVAEVMSSDRDLSRATGDLGANWEIKKNGLKPYACGVVSHASIDAAVRLRARGVDVDQIEAVDARVHHLVPELMGRAEVATGLEGKFSCRHTIAVGLIDGSAYPAQFADARVLDERVVALRRKVNLIVDAGMEEDSAVLTLRMKDGSSTEEHVEHATGSPENPMTDALLEDKFLTLASSTLGEARAKSLLAELWRLDESATLPDLRPQG